MSGRFETVAAYRQSVEARLMASYGPERVQWGRKAPSGARLIAVVDAQDKATGVR